LVNNYGGIVTLGQKNINAIVSEGDNVMVEFHRTPNYVIISTNGGTTWTDVSGSYYSGAGVVNSAMAIADPNTVFFQTNVYADDIEKTSNFGTSWTEKSPIGFTTTPKSKSVYFRDANLGIVISVDGTEVFTTNDGGDTWISINPPPAPITNYNTQNRPHIVSENEFWIITRNYGASGTDNYLTMFHTTNGGTSWTQKDFNGGSGGSALNIIYS
jgi:photosystem II stability/assembly factor-like uncharacterized protein